ncbi:hypothetical protein IPM19_01485 [bacterium]|nr:MAG: hypothetical protein IPM19_01485 [bacterium]
MDKSKRKALYVFLTTLLGVLIFLMFHRAVFVIYDILASFYPNSPAFDIAPNILFGIDFYTMLLAVVLGGWYGVWLGLDWYKMIYEERGVTRWFHGFLPHNLRGHRSHKQNTHKPASVPKQITVKTSSPRVESFESFRRTAANTAWSFDDVEKAPAKPKRKAPAKKRVAKKRVTKTKAE